MKSEADLHGTPPTVTVTMNENCTSTSIYNSGVSFGVQEKGSSYCHLQQYNRPILMPGVPATFFTTLIVNNSQEYCFETCLPCELNHHAHVKLVK